jgi:hypothetical protein
MWSPWLLFASVVLFSFLFTDRLSSLVVSFWLQIQRSGFVSRRYQIFWEVVGLERGPLSLVSITEEVLGRKSSGSGIENWDYGRRGSAQLTTRHLSIRRKLALTLPTSGIRSVGIVRSQTQATKFVSVCFYSAHVLVKRKHLISSSQNLLLNNSYKCVLNFAGQLVRIVLNKLDVVCTQMFSPPRNRMLLLDKDFARAQGQTWRPSWVPSEICSLDTCAVYISGKRYSTDVIITDIYIYIYIYIYMESLPEHRHNKGAQARKAQIQFLGEANFLLFTETCIPALWPTSLPSHAVGTLGPFPTIKHQGVKLAAHLHLVLCFPSIMLT